MADAMMKPLGEANGVKWYWADPGQFEKPGVYYWDGDRNVLCVPYPHQQAVQPTQAEAQQYHVEHRTNACSEVCTADGKVFATAAWTTEAGARAQLICNLLNGTQPTQPEAPSEPLAWRDLALQFDGHRMQALGWLKLIVRELPQTPAWVGLRHFLASPPLSGEAVLAERIAALAAQQAAQVDGFDTYNSNGLAWAVSRWKDEVSQRPFLNVHRRTLDDTWRQVVRFFGGDPDALLGPAHDALVARQQHIGGNG